MITTRSLLLLAACLALVGADGPGSGQERAKQEVEAAILRAATTAAAAAGAPPQQQQQQQEESYQRVYEAFTKLMDNVSNNSLGNVRRLVSRLNQLVGGQEQPAGQPTAAGNRREQSSAGPASDEDKRTEQILSRLDGVNKSTDQNTLRQLNEDVSRLVGTLSDSYLRNIRRVIERVNRAVGRPALAEPAPQKPAGLRLHLVAADGATAAAPSESRQGANSHDDDPNRQPGFPGWDELIVAVDRVQKSLASFVRSSTKLITAGRK